VLRKSPALPFVALALLVWVSGVARARLLGPAGAQSSPPPWQRSFLELTQPQQRLYRELREGLDDAENRRADSKRWPAPAELAADGVPPFAAGGPWALKVEGVYVNYTGEAEGLRWLVLLIEPAPGLLRAPNEQPPPVDEEHHTLPDGTAIHVTVWTRPLTDPPPAGLLPFPATQGWVQRIGR
jgi:hypothetical protein